MKITIKATLYAQPKFGGTGRRFFEKECEHILTPQQLKSLIENRALNLRLKGTAYIHFCHYESFDPSSKTMNISGSLIFAEEIPEQILDDYFLALISEGWRTYEKVGQFTT